MDKITLDELKQYPVWLAWGHYPEKEKRPFSVSKLTSQWQEVEGSKSDYNTIYNYTGRKKGAGFVTSALTDDTQLCFIDLDPDKKTGEISKEAKEVLHMWAGKTYIEKSHSGKGYHIYFIADIAKLPEKQTDYYFENLDNSKDETLCKARMECYTTATKFSVMTGNMAAESNPERALFNQTQLALETLNRFFLKPENVQAAEKETVKETASPLAADTADIEFLPLANTKAEVLQKATNANNAGKFCRLYYDGNMEEYHDNQSQADQALLEIIAYYTGDNPELVAEVFRDSALYRGDDKGGRNKNYLSRSIDVAITAARKYRKETYKVVPNAGNKSNKREPLTLDVFAQWLNDNNISARWNAISHKNEIKRTGECYDPSDDTLHILIHDVLKRDYICSKSDILDNLHAIAYKNKYNPILELLADADRIKQLEADKDAYRMVYDKDPDYFSVLTDDVMQLPPDDTLSRVLIRKWLINTRLLWNNTNRNESEWMNNEAVLVLNGGQGIGKTRLVSKLGFNNALLCRTGVSIDPNNKDSVIGATTYALVEVGELETTFRKDVEALKNFITSKHDNYRPPYGREEKTYPRLTAFIGTCNSDRFLKDETGNRRYFSIPCVNKFSDKALINFNTFGLWKQVEAWIAAGETYFLTDEETQALNTRNSECVDLLRGQQEIKDILTHARNNPHEYTGAWLTATKFKEKYMDTLRPYSAQQIGRALKAEGLEQRKKSLTDVETGKRKTIEGYYLPVPAVITYDNADRPIKPAKPYTPYDGNADNHISITS